MTATALTEAAIAAQIEVDRLHKAVWANPRDTSLVGQLSAAMKTAREARLACQAESGRTFTLPPTATALAAERAHSKHLDSEI